MRNYHINLFYRDDDNGYIVDITNISDLQHCAVCSATPEEALREGLTTKISGLRQ